MKDSDTLYCEAYFLEEDRERAVERHHLTAKTAGRIAREAGVKNLVVMHFSPKYREFPDEPEKEAMMEYKKDFIFSSFRCAEVFFLSYYFNH